jgi:hypothetical protein
MATVRAFRLRRFFLLPPVALLGRDPSSDLVLPAARSSGRHAEIRARTSGSGWDIRDLGSSNGTRLDGEVLVAGLWVPLRVGSEIVLGDRDERWTVIDLLPPGPCLFDPATGEVVQPEDGRLGERLIYDLEREAWCIEDEPVEAGALLDGYELHLPPTDRAMLTTLPARIELSRARLRIVASRDLDRIDLHLDDGPVRVSFPGKAWAIALYVLALERQADRDDGWMEVGRLARRCGLNRRVLDVYLLRAREQFVKDGVGNGEGVIEVRRGARRLGVPNVSVEHGDG